MLAPLLVMLHEGLMAALIVGIVAGCLGRTGRRNWMPAVWAGVFLAAAVAFFAGAAIQLLAGDFPQGSQELVEAAIGLLAVATLMSLVLWMRRAARSMKSELQGRIEARASETLAQARR